MNILLAPNSMKGSIDAISFADALEQGLLAYSSLFQLKKCPIADGGDGTGEVLAQAFNAQKIISRVHDPLMRIIDTPWYWNDNGIAIIEMADASGMKLLQPQELNPMLTTSFGTGELIVEAIKKGAIKIILGVGGSATVDGGMGALEALGVNFYDSKGKELSGTGEHLQEINAIDVSECIQTTCEIVVACDVDNYLLGEKGAVRVFAPQKGANEKMVVQLEQGLTHFSNSVKAHTGCNIAQLKHAGAAGGIAGGLAAFMNARLTVGAELIMKWNNFDKLIDWADVVITGEGRIDKQTSAMKAPYCVAQKTKKYGKQVIAVAGTVEAGAEVIYDKIFTICDERLSLNQAMENAVQLIEKIGYKIGKTIV